MLKFEYLSQILVDSGCMLLILKLLGLQEVALLASKKTDDNSQRFVYWLFIEFIYTYFVLVFLGL